MRRINHDELLQIVSASGVVAMVGIAWFQQERKAINWRTIGWATALAVILASWS